MPRYVVRDGEWEASVDDAADQIRAALDDAGRVMLEAVERETEGIYRDARRLWPVGSRPGPRSRDSLTWRVVFRRDEIIGEVRAGAKYARYIQSSQIATGPRVTEDEVAVTLHSAASRDRRTHPTEGEVRATYRERAARNLSARAHVRRLGKSRTKAARSGSAMWLLLRWPEKAAADRLEAELGPLIEAELAQALED